MLAIDASGNITFGNSAQSPTIIQGSGIRLASAGTEDVNFRGIYSGTASAPTTTELPTDLDCCIWEETDTNTWTLFINDNGTIRQIS